MFLNRKTKIKHITKKLSTLVVYGLCMIISHPALAAGAAGLGRGTLPAGAGAPAGGGGGQTLGQVIGNTINSASDIPGLLAGLSYLMGVILGFMAIWKLKEHVENPNQVPIWDPMKRFLAGGLFVGLPTIVHAAFNTVAKNIDPVKGDGFNTGGVSSTGLDAKLVALVKDVFEPLQYLFVGFGYIAGIILILIGISRLLKTEQEGARGPMGLGTIMTFLVAGVLLSMNRILGATVGSLFGGEVTSHASLSYTAGMDGAAIGHANAVIGAILAFVAIIGWISFIRGFFIMRGVAEGSSQASAMAGFTHIFGGALAVNLGGFIQAVQSTLGITQFGLTFASIESYATSVTFFV